jgi:acetylglutamate kinase
MTDAIFQKNKTDQVIETLKYVKAFCGHRILVKISGSALNDKALVQNLCEDFAYMRAAGISLVIVHGGGLVINETLKSAGIEWTFHQGLRVTTPKMMNIIEDVMVKNVNATLVNTLNENGVRAQGFSGKTQGLLTCVRMDKHLGEVGQVVKVQAEQIEALLNSQKQSMQGTIPVVAPIGVDDNGHALNVNADWACVALAKALKVQKMIYLTNEDGIYTKEKFLISTVDTKGLKDLIADETATGGMAVKCQTIINALEAGIDHVHIINGVRPHALIQEIFTDQGVGTICIPEKKEVQKCFEQKTF